MKIKLYLQFSNDDSVLLNTIVHENKLRRNEDWQDMLLRNWETAKVFPVHNLFPFLEFVEGTVTTKLGDTVLSTEAGCLRALQGRMYQSLIRIVPYPDA